MEDDSFTPSNLQRLIYAVVRTSNEPRRSFIASVAGIYSRISVTRCYDTRFAVGTLQVRSSNSLFLDRLEALESHRRLASIYSIYLFIRSCYHRGKENSYRFTNRDTARVPRTRPRRPGLLLFDPPRLVGLVQRRLTLLYLYPR